MRRTETGINPDAIARARIGILFSRAFLVFPENPALGARYISLGRKIALRHAIRLGKMRELYCKNCNSPRIPGRTAKYRALPGKILSITCLVCGETNRRKLGERLENGAKTPVKKP